MDTKEIIEKINKYSEGVGSAAREVGVLIFGFVKDMKSDEQKTIVKDIKESNELKLNHQFVYECFNMVRKFPEMMEQDWKPLENLTIGHYFEASKFKFSGTSAHVQLSIASEEKQSIREMRDAIREVKNDLPFEEKEIKELMKENCKKIHEVKDLKKQKEIKKFLEQYK